MNPITQAIREMYEQYPYPATPEMEIRLGSDVRLLLSYGQLMRKAGRPLKCLDAGCGRGNGVLGAASTQPDVHFTGIDLNRVALKDATDYARQQGIKNVKFQEVDLMTLEGLEVPEGGFDVIYSSGVVHHLASPEEGLRQLRRVLAPHGIISFMVYGKQGRESLYRMVRAVDLVIGRDHPLSERLTIAKQMMQEMPAEAVRVGPCGVTEGLHDNEFLDRYLNVNETCYDVASVWKLIESSGLKFLRWADPADWNLPVRTPVGAALTAHLTPFQRFQVIEQLYWRHKLDLILGAAENQPREFPARETWPTAYVAFNPEVVFLAETRNLRNQQRAERLSYQLRLRKAVPLVGLVASVVLAFKDRTAPFQSRIILDRLKNSGIAPAQALDLLDELLKREILYFPHQSEV